MRTTIGVVALACGLLVAAHAAPADAQSARKATGEDGVPATRSSLTGRITLKAGPRQDVEPEEISQTVIYFLPAERGARPAPKQFSVATYTKGFDPNLLVIPVGSTVTFPNRDTIIHNVFSTTPGAAFDLGTYAPGQARAHQFTKPGLVVINCNVHRGMRANVLVLETPYSTRARPDGSFSLAGLPVGAGTLVVWHPRASAQSVAVTGRSTQLIERTLVATRPRIGSHH